MEDIVSIAAPTAQRSRRHMGLLLIDQVLSRCREPKAYRIVGMTEGFVEAFAPRIYMPKFV